jgi:hypothetical protein
MYKKGAAVYVGFHGYGSLSYNKLDREAWQRLFTQQTLSCLAVQRL